MADHKFPVELGHVMMFARAVGDPNPIYFDEEYAKHTPIGHVIAPPTFVQASAQFDPRNRLRPKPGEPWLGSGREPSGIPVGARTGGGTGLHAEQHFEYHRHLRPGDVLTKRMSEGAAWEREGRRGGTLTFRETITEYFDKDGALVVSARSIGVVTSRPVA